MSWQTISKQSSSYSNVSKNVTAYNEQFIEIGDGFFLEIGDGYKLRIQSEGDDWNVVTKN